MSLQVLCGVTHSIPRRFGSLVKGRHLSLRSVLRVAVLAVASLVSANTFAALNQGSYPDWATRWPAEETYDQDCRPLWIPNKYGPFEYRTASPADRELVEGAHFTEEYDAYLKGREKSARKQNELPPAAGFGYTLWAFPNQPQALAAMEDLGIRHKTENLPGAMLRVHCFFQRAVRFAPDDALIRAIYGYYYARRGKFAEAKVQLEKVDSLGSNVSSVFVYTAFSYIEMKDYEKALEAAKRAYQLGYSLPGLRNRLERVGKWHD